MHHGNYPVTIAGPVSVFKNIGENMVRNQNPQKKEGYKQPARFCRYFFHKLPASIIGISAAPIIIAGYCADSNFFLISPAFHSKTPQKTKDLILQQFALYNPVELQHNVNKAIIRLRQRLAQSNRLITKGDE